MDFMAEITTIAKKRGGVIETKATAQHSVSEACAASSACCA